MARLAIDTSSPITSVAIEHRSNLYVREDISKGSHSKSLGQLVQEVVSEARISSLAELTQVVVGLGPGSFTGLRISLAFAKGISLMQDTPIAYVSSFRAIAQAAVSADGTVAVMSDARRGEFFFSTYTVSNGTVASGGDVAMCDSDHIRKQLSQIDGSITLVDAGCETAPEMPVSMRAVSRVAIGLLALEPAGVAQCLSEISSLEPLYVRQVSALTIEDRRRLGML